MTDTTEKIPTEKLVVDLPEELIGTAEAALYVASLVLTTARSLAEAGRRPWLQLWYPWTTEENFDAVEVDLETSEIKTLPSFVELTMTNKVVNLDDILA